MIMGVSAAPPPRAVRRIANNLGLAAALVVSLVSPAGARVVTTISTLITIPPAQLPPLPAAATPASAPAEGEPLPAELQILRDPRGSGLAMYGALTGKTDSAAGTLLAVFAHSPTFDPPAAARLLLADEGDRHAQALFTAMVRGAPMIGVAAATLGDPGGDVAVFYDKAESFPASFVRLQQALAPSAVVEIGVSDNSVYEADATAENNADGNWDQVIAAVAKGGEAPIDRDLARAMADKLAGDTGQRWLIVSPATLR